MNACTQQGLITIAALTSSDHQTPRSGAAAIAAIATWSDLRAARRRQLVGYVERAAEICAVPLEGLTMSCAWLNGRFYAKRPMAHGLSRSSFGNVASALRFVLERLGEHEAQSRKHCRMAPHWSALLSQMSDANHRAGLAEFARFCTAQDIAPAEVLPDTVELFERWVTHRILHRDIRRLALNVERCWKKAQALVPEWPPVQLRLPRVKGQMSLPLDTFPPSLADDLRRFEAELAGDYRPRSQATPNSESGKTFRARTRPARPATIATRRKQAIAAANALAGSGIAPEAIQTLRDLVDPLDRAERIFEHFWAKAGNQPSSHTAGIAAVLKRIASIHCDPSVPGAAQIATWTREMTPKLQRGLTAKNRARLAAMVAPTTRRLLLNLPCELVERAQIPGTPRKAAVSLMMAAVVIEILLHCPLRAQNLRTLRLGLDLRRHDPRSPHFTHLSIAEERVKNSNPIEWALAPETAGLITTWLREFRRVPAPEEAVWLFPGRTRGAISETGIYNLIVAKIGDTIGIEVNPHLFRHFAVWLHLKHHPGDYETARRLLGHSTVETTVRFYAGLEAEAAAERHDAIIEAERREGKGAASASFRKSRPRVRQNRKPATPQTLEDASDA